jgi:hypothetical protein
MVSIRSTLRVTVVAGFALASIGLAPADSVAGPSDRRDSSPRIVASGLNNPRHLRWFDGALYVAESGRGGSAPCVPSPEGPAACYGPTGSITRIKHHRQSRVVRGLPSLATAGENASGPVDVRVQGRRFTVALGFGADPSLRASLPPNAQTLGTVSTGRFGRSGLRVVADVAAYEARVNPDGGPKDTNPTALLQRGRRAYVVDAGGNSLLRYRRDGRIRTVAVFPDLPGFPGGPPTTDFVPTAAAYGPDGAIYVSQLTGFPFPVGAASIWRVVPGRQPVKYATGLTNVTDLAFGKDGSLYVVQIADQGLLAPNPTGSVVRIRKGGGDSHKTVIGNLTAPYGIALRGKSAYVTVCSTCAGGGKVLRIPLR